MGDELHGGLGIWVRDAVKASQLPIDLGSRLLSELEVPCLDRGLHVTPSPWWNPTVAPIPGRD
jgi:hypothetical protein